MIKSNTHSVSVVVYAENILVQRLVLITDETGYPVTVIQCTDERPITRTGIGSDQALARQDIENAINPKRLPLTGFYLKAVPPPELDASNPVDSICVSI